MYSNLLFNILSIVWNIKIQVFVSRVHGCCVLRFIEIGEIAWERFEKEILQHFMKMWKKAVSRNGRGLIHKIHHNSVNAWI